MNLMPGLQVVQINLDPLCNAVWCLCNSRLEPLQWQRDGLSCVLEDQVGGCREHLGPQHAVDSLVRQRTVANHECRLRHLRSLGARNRHSSQLDAGLGNGEWSDVAMAGQERVAAIYSVEHLDTSGQSCSILVAHKDAYRLRVIESATRRRNGWQIQLAVLGLGAAFEGKGPSRGGTEACTQQSTGCGVVTCAQGLLQGSSSVPNAFLCPLVQQSLHGFG
mmetsp:Transcript_57429/g.134461  ORF Transcript_57429/g.134461 Transcript_57429/m.134461 type:complete len:220 (-) Transcript_57429:1196-1855(-)